MKQTLLTICLILFALPSWGNNISDFKIDGLGIGDSLLEFMTQDEIIQSSSASVYSSDKVKFSDVSILEHSVFSNKEKIWNFRATIKKDRKFVIEGISLSEG